MTIRVFIANRGEIAIRIARSVRELGMVPIGIYTIPDKNSLHRRYLQEDVEVTSYIDVKEVVNAAVVLGADLVHPGYGFLSESPEFAEEVRGKGLTFVGPSPEAMRLSGDKLGAKEAASKAGVPTLPWLASRDPKEVEEFAREHGYPLLVKAAGGGGGIGMRVIYGKEELERKLEQSSKEAERAFGDPRIFVEPYMAGTKHIEVQILADGDKAIHLYERDCSLQRRFQKIVEEAPAPALTPEQRKSILADAVKLMESVKYSNAGTVEMLFDPRTGRHYFMEINARLQVEHTVTEMATGVDIVKKQLLIALEGSLPLRQEDVVLRGHAVEARINAENPVTLLPSPGTITQYREPGGPGIRVDSGYAAGYTIPMEYNMLISKVIAYGETRDEAIARLERALGEYVIRGVETNIPLIRALLDMEEFRKGVHTTDLLAEKWAHVERRVRRLLEAQLLVGAAVIAAGKAKLERAGVKVSSEREASRAESIKRRAWTYWYMLRSRLPRR
ncbi:MAG: biotin carboxylase N-terminal domain-containing protein [Desulfurococcaceae archaeon]